MRLKSKIELRQWTKSLAKNAYPANHGLAASAKRLTENLFHLFQGLGSGLGNALNLSFFPANLAAFFPSENEPKILHYLWSDDRFRLAFPDKMTAMLGQKFYFLRPRPIQWEFVRRLYYSKENLYYLPEMRELKNQKISLEDFPFVLVPGLVFSYSGQRLGRGQGHYDRVLSQYCGIKIGICYEEYLLEDCWEISAHDQQMDYIVTEKQIISCKYF